MQFRLQTLRLGAAIAAYIVVAQQRVLQHAETQPRSERRLAPVKRIFFYYAVYAASGPRTVSAQRSSAVSAASLAVIKLSSFDLYIVPAQEIRRLHALLSSRLKLGYQ